MRDDIVVPYTSEFPPPQTDFPPPHHLFGLEASARGFPPGEDEKKKDPPGSRGFPPGVDRFRQKKKTPPPPERWCCSILSLFRGVGKH